MCIPHDYLPDRCGPGAGSPAAPGCRSCRSARGTLMFRQLPSCCGVGRRIRQHVLVGQLRDDLVEDAVELLARCGKNARPPVASRVALEAGAQLRHGRAAAEADGVEHRVARLHPRGRRFAPGQAVAIVAVGEDDDALAAPLPADQIERADRRVVERRAAPRRQQIDRLLARRRSFSRSAARNIVSLKPTSVAASPGRSFDSSCLTAGFTCRAHAPCCR